LTSIWRTEISVKERVLIRIKALVQQQQHVFYFHTISSLVLILLNIYIYIYISPGSVHCMSMLYVAYTQNFSSKLLRMSERLIRTKTVMTMPLIELH
jgi:hypothetical protein